MTFTQSSTTQSAAQRATELYQRDKTLIQQHEGYILQLAASNKDPVAISLYLQKREIDIRISAIRSFLYDN